jgi:uncharacterized protein (TIGR00661 family)
MRVLYGVNGEGMGHATRSQVVIDSLRERHEVRVVASGAAYRYLRERLPDVDETVGPSFVLEDGEIRRWATVRRSVRDIGDGAPATIRRWLEMMQGWRPEAVVTDFEPLAATYARVSRTPLIAVDNISILDRCRHDREILADHRDDFTLARAVARSMVPNAVWYLVTTFFQPPKAKLQTRLVPPILRPEILAAETKPGEHLLVYSSGEAGALATLRASGLPCRIYGMRGGPAEGTTDGNLEFRPRSNEGFVEDLRSARAVIAGGGFSLMCEAVYLRKPMLAMPLRGQFEQVLNARYLEREGYGIATDELTPDALDRFLTGLERFEQRLGEYRQRGNEEALAAVEGHLLAAAEARSGELRRARRISRSRDWRGWKQSRASEAEEG